MLTRSNPSDLAVPLSDLGAMTAEVASAVDRAWLEAKDTSVFVGGAQVERFEEEWARYCGTRYAVGVANGTDALELTIRALGIGRGDEVIVPANTFVATVEAIVLAGATPRFADVDPATLLVTAETVAPTINRRTAALVVVELYGGMPAMDDIRRLADATRIALIEDAAQSHGSRWHGRNAGSFGVAGCFSFYPGKNLGAFGDAGAVTTDDRALAERIRSLGNHGRAADAAHIHRLLGRNSRLDALQAGVLAAKLTALDRWNEARREAVATYRTLLDPEIVRFVAVGAGVESAHHLNVVRVARRDVVRKALAAQMVETGVHYPIPCHLQEPYERFTRGRLPEVELAAQEVLSLPLFPHITETQVRRVAACLNRCAQSEVRHGR